jgi:hypothetical protein
MEALWSLVAVRPQDSINQLSGDVLPVWPANRGVTMSRNGEQKLSPVQVLLGAHFIADEVPGTREPWLSHRVLLITSFVNSAEHLSRHHFPAIKTEGLAETRDPQSTTSTPQLALKTGEAARQALPLGPARVCLESGL